MSRRGLLLLAVVVGGCDVFAPRADDGRAFAIFGTLDGRSDRQELRVQDLAGSTLDTPDRLPATVTSTDLSTGQTTVWRDSLVTLPDGVRAHVFVADLAVAVGETHRIEAVRDDASARSSVTVSLRTPTVTQGPSALPANSSATVRINGFTGRLTDPSFRYVVRRSDSSDLVSFLAPSGIPQQDQGTTFYVAFLFNAESQATNLLYGSDTESAPVFVDARLEAFAVSTARSPVENGVGEVGWAAPVSVSIPFQTDALTRVGFVDGR